MTSLLRVFRCPQNICSVRFATLGAVPKPAKRQIKISRDEPGHFMYERDFSRDNRYTRPQKIGDTPRRFMLRRLGHAYEVYPLLLLAGWWLFLLTVFSYHSFEKVEVWLDRREKLPPSHWTRIRENYWKKATVIFDRDARTHRRLDTMEKLQDELMNASVKRQN